MARIKAVINERRLAYEGAVKLVDKQREQHQDNVVLQHQVTEQRKERKYLQRRRAYMERRNAERLMRRKAHEKTLLEKRLWATDTEVKTEGAKASEEKQIPVSVESFTGSEVQAEMPSEPPAKATSPTIKPADSKNEKDQKTAVKKAKLPKAFPKPAVDQTPSTPIDAAAAGLFGVAQVGKGSRRG
jgi:large subunit ribosomal protein L47